MRKIAVANRKGGVGKTTTAVNLAAGLALAGKKVLLVDTDTQGHCSRLLGATPEKGLAQVIEGTAQASAAVIEARKNLFLLAGGPELAGSSRIIARRNMRSEYVLAEALKPLEETFDVVILDTAPGFTELSVNVLFYAEELVIPVSMEALAVDGLLTFLDEVDKVEEYSRIGVRWILPTFLDGRVSKTAEILGGLQKHFGEKLAGGIHYSARLSEAPAHGLTIYEYAKGDRAAHEYAEFAEAI
jgi:chromosome partitioning protein